MDVFSALAESRRRDIIEMLAMKGQLSASEISNKFNVSPSAISQHLKVLREARLVDMEKRAQSRIYTINTKTMAELEVWVHRMGKMWEERFERLDKVLKKQR